MATPSIFQSLVQRQTGNRPWVEVAHIHNALLDNQFLDILEVHAAANGFTPDQGPSFASRHRALSSEFRRHVIGALIRSYSDSTSPASIVTIPPENLSSGASSARAVTRQALQSSAAIIVNPVFADDDARIIARLPLLLRPDVAQSLLNLPQIDHYVPVAMKRKAILTDPTDPIALRPSCLTRTLPELYAWLELLSKELSVKASHVAVVGLNPSRKLSVPSGAFVTKESPNIPFNPNVWRAALVNLDKVPEARTLAKEALVWRCSVVDDGKSWLVANETKLGDRSLKSSGEPNGTFPGALYALAASTTDYRKRPNMKVAYMYDWPWCQAKRLIAEGIRELTLISGVNNSMVKDALARGIPNDYLNPLVTAEALGATSELTSRVLQMCKESYKGPVVFPCKLAHNRQNWRLLKPFDVRAPCSMDVLAAPLPSPDEISFYVDFELASVDSLHAVRPNSSKIPDNMKDLAKVADVVPAEAFPTEFGLHPNIFLIGCGTVINGIWSYRAFVADALDVQCESEIVRQWLIHMHSQLPENMKTPHVFVWGPEQQLLRRAMKRMKEETRREVRESSDINIINMLQVVVSGGLVVQGNYNNSLKRVAKALETHGLLPKFEGGPLISDVHNGLDVMAVVLDGVETMHKSGESRLGDLDSMKQATIYNELDCFHLARITKFLRKF